MLNEVKHLARAKRAASFIRLAASRGSMMARG
jgi:hypothetical protein